MPSLNKVFLIGNLTQDPTLRQTKSGASVANFSLAINQRYTGTRDLPADQSSIAGAKEEASAQTGEKKEKVCFVDIVAWNKLAQASASYLTKGKCVFVEGSLSQNKWEQEGRTRSKLEVLARTIQFLSPRNAKL